MAAFSPKQKFASDGESAALLPSISVPSYPAQDKNTITGVVPPVAYTKVNASVPPVPDAGSSAQKSIAPMGAQALPKTAQAFSREDPTMNMTHRPLVQDLVKQAMSNAAQRAKIADEGARQMKLAEEKCGECNKEPCECKKDKKASVSGGIETDFVLKLAAAIEFAAPQVVEMSKKEAASNMPPPHFSEKQQEGPEGVSASNQGGTPPGPGGQGKGHMQPPTNPGTQKAMPQEHGATQLENTMNHPVPGEQTTAMSGGKGKTASAEDLLKKNSEFFSKIAKVKQAEDAINPASISAGPAVPPETSASGESGGAPVAGMPQGPRGLVGSNESAINYKKQTAYAPRKSELAQYFNEPALSSATDSTLNQAFAHTGEAGVKISAAQLLKSASARALLAKLAGETKEALVPVGMTPAAVPRPGVATPLKLDAQGAAEKAKKLFGAGGSLRPALKK